MSHDNAPCSGQRIGEDRCFTCGHSIYDHNVDLVCKVCDEPDDYAEMEAEAMAWWRSQQ